MIDKVAVEQVHLRHRERPTRHQTEQGDTIEESTEDAEHQEDDGDAEGEGEAAATKDVLEPMGGAVERGMHRGQQRLQLRHRDVLHFFNGAVCILRRGGLGRSLAAHAEDESTRVDEDAAREEVEQCQVRHESRHGVTRVQQQRRE